MSTAKRTYGRKSKPVLTPHFFSSSPETPEVRRSPRRRKALQEKSHNVQTTAAAAVQISPCKPRMTVVVPRKEDVIEILEVVNEDEPVKTRSRRTKKRSLQPEPTALEDDLTQALDGLAISKPVSTPEALPYEKFATPVIPRSITRRPASSSFSVRKPPKLLRQHSIPLSASTAAFISPLISCKNVSRVVESFEDWVDERTALLSFSKIGEGSYGQVFRATDAGGETVIIKLMPLNSQKNKDSTCFTTIDSAATEVQLLEKMQKVPGYVEFRGACVLQGKMPEHFVNLWQEYMESGRTVESYDPRIKESYSEDQLWLMLELSDAGTNLEPGRYMPPGLRKVPKNGKYLDVARVWDVFWQVTHAVAKAEVYCEFEHRDLHLGNICVRDLAIEEDTPVLSVKAPFPIDSSGILVTIIDYTLSRANMSVGETLAFDFQSDPCLFTGQGDLQYDIYRWMDEVLGERGCKTYDPRTNVLWLFHLLKKLLSVTTAAPRGKAGQSARQMKKLLDRVQDMIDPDYMEEWLANSAGDLLQCAYAEEWIAASVV